MRPYLSELSARINREQVVRFGFSLILATMLWGWVTNQQDPIQTERFENVTIEVPPLPSTLQIVNELPAALVEITGPRSVVGDVPPRDVSATLNVSAIEQPGTYTVAVVARVPDEVRESEAVPREIQVQVEATISRTFPLTTVRPSTPNDPRTVGAVTPDASRVTVNGSESSVLRVNRVVLPIALGENADDFRAVFALYAADAQGERIADVTVLPETVSAFVEVQTRGKNVSVVPQTDGAPAEGFSVVQSTVTPQTVVVDGPPEVLADLLFIETEPIDVNGATESMERQVGFVDLPAGVSVVDPPSNQVEVTVVIQEVGVAQELADLPIELFGLGDGLSARVEPETVSVTVDAPGDLLGAMSAGDVKVRVDLSGRGPGIYELRPEVTVPQGVTWIGNEPQSVRIVVEPAATPASGAATPSATG